MVAINQIKFNKGKCKVMGQKKCIHKYRLEYNW